MSKHQCLPVPSLKAGGTPGYGKRNAAAQGMTMSKPATSTKNQFEPTTAAPMRQHHRLAGAGNP